MSIQRLIPNPSPTDSFTILVVDDNKDIVEFVRYLLAHHGFKVKWAYSGKECLETVNSECIDLLVLDVMMPQMDGLEVCRVLKQSHPSLPVILLTAKDDLRTRATAMTLGVSDFLAKPVNIDDFLSRIRDHRDNYRWNKSLDATIMQEQRTRAKTLVPN